MFCISLILSYLLGSFFYSLFVNVLYCFSSFLIFCAQSQVKPNQQVLNLSTMFFTMRMWFVFNCYFVLRFSIFSSIFSMYSFVFILIILQSFSATSYICNIWDSASTVSFLSWHPSHSHSPFLVIYSMLYIFVNKSNVHP